MGNIGSVSIMEMFHPKLMNASVFPGTLCKRINNILRKNSNEFERIAMNNTLLQEKDEKYLANKLDIISFIVQPLIKNSNYTEALIILADMRETVDNFFNRVMVMVDDKVIRKNRFALLHRTRNLFLSVADISFLQK